MDIMLKRILELIGDKHGSSKELADFIGVNSLFGKWARLSRSLSIRQI